MNLQLRPHQMSALDGLRAGFAAGHRAQILCGPCGFGKTELAIAMMSAASAKYKRAAMVLDRVVLCDQTSARLSKYGIEHGVLRAGVPRRMYERVQVCSAQTLEKMGQFPDLDLLIVDEAHCQREQTTAFIRANPSIKVVGLTATPFAKGMGSTYTNVVCAATTHEMVEAGFLVPLRVYVATQIDMADAKKVAGEWSQKDAGERGVKIVGDVVSEWVAKTTAVFGRQVKTIAFSANVAHAAELSQAFASAGFNFVPLSYKDDDEYKADVIADFARPDTAIHGVIATDILTKGFDVPDVMCGISARPFSKSFSSHVQQMGRVMRPFEGKQFGLWLDHSGNFLRFRDQWDEVYNDGVRDLPADGRDKPAKEPTDEEKERAKCPACGALWIGRQDTCYACGHTRKVRSAVIEVAGQMSELGAADRKAQQRFYAELLAYQSERNYKPSWAAVNYKERYGSWPRFGDIEPASSVSEGTRNWVISRRIAFRAAQKKARMAA